jgi:hypothetical protein
MSKDNKGEKEEKKRKKVIKELHERKSINFTGLPPNTVIVGVGGVGKGVQLKHVSKTSIYPRKEDIAWIRSVPSEWKFLQEKVMDQIPFFAKQTEKEREQWFKNAVSGEKSFTSHNPNIEFQLMGQELPKALKFVPDSVVETWMRDQDGTFKAKELEKLHMESAGIKRSLLFLPSFWQIAPAPASSAFSRKEVSSSKSLKSTKASKEKAKEKEKESLYINLDRKTVSHQRTHDEKKKSQIISITATLHIETQSKLTEQNKPTLAQLKTMIQNKIVVPQGHKANIARFEQDWKQLESDHILQKFLAAPTQQSFLKSWLQKLIRFQSQRILLSTHYVLSSHALLYCMCKLIVSPGVFNSEIKAYVRGVSAFAKRLAVIAVEDAYVPNSAPIITQLLAAALANTVGTSADSDDLVNENQEKKLFFPSLANLLSWLKFGLRLQKSQHCLNFKTDQNHALVTQPLEVKNEQGFWNLNAFLLQLAKSFPGDLQMMYDIAKRGRHVSTTAHNAVVRSTCPIWHLIDQHYDAAVIYFLDPRYVDDGKSVNYDSIMQRFFNQVTGLNKRRHAIDEKDEFFQAVRKAQEHYWFYRRPSLAGLAGPLNEHKAQQQQQQITFSLSDAWIVGAIGAKKYVIERKEGESKKSKKRIETMAMLRTDDLSKIVVSLAVGSKRAKRNTLELTEDETTEVQEAFERELRSGKLKWAACSSPHPDIVQGQTKLKLEKDNRWSYQSPNGVKTLWNPNIKIQCSTFSDLKTWQSNQDKIYVRAYPTLRRYLKDMNLASLNRALLYLGTFTKEVELPDPKQNNDTNINDIHVFNLLRMIRICLPMAFRPSHKTYQKLTHFQVLKGPLVWKLKEMIQKTISQSVYRSVNPSPVSSISSASSKDAKDVKEESNIFAFPARENIGWNHLVNKLKSPFELRRHQVEALKNLERRRRLGYTKNLIWMAVRSGKTLVCLHYLRDCLKIYGNKCKYIIFVSPAQPMSSIPTQFKDFGFSRQQCYLLIGTQTKEPVVVKNLKDQLDEKKGSLQLLHIPPSSVKKTIAKIPKYSVLFVERDQLKYLMSSQILNSHLISQSLVVIDELHDSLNETQRTGTALTLASGSLETLGMTGTLTGTEMYEQLIPWFAQLENFEVNKTNMWVVSGSLVVHVVESANTPVEHILKAPMTEAQQQKFRSLVSKHLGGDNKYAVETRDLHPVAALCEDICVRYMIQFAVRQVYPSFFVSSSSSSSAASASSATKGIRGMVLVAKSKKHEGEIKELLLQYVRQHVDVKADPLKIMLCVGEQGSKDLLPGKAPKDLKFVIVPLKFSTGFSLAAFQHMITCVYPSNEASREQTRGRIEGIRAEPVKLFYYTVVDSMGFLELTHQHHTSTRETNLVLQEALKL